MDVESTTMAAKMRTRLNTFSHDEINLLLRSGYARADAPIRTHKLVDNSPMLISHGYRFWARSDGPSLSHRMSDGCIGDL
jgi:hypothetical protein